MLQILDLIYLKKFQELTLISFNDNLFEGAQQEVVVLLGKTRSENKGFRFIELDSLNDLDSFDINDDVPLIKDVEVSRDKWLKYFLKPSELSNFKLAISHKDLLKKSRVYSNFNQCVVLISEICFFCHRPRICYAGGLCRSYEYRQPPNAQGVR